MADIEMVERRIDKAQKAMKGGDKKFAREVEVFSGLLEHLNQGKLVRPFDGSEEDMALIATSDLLTLKKTIYVANLAENEVNDPGQPGKPLIRHGNHAHIGVNGAERVIVRRDACVCDRVEQGGLAHIGKSHNT